MGKDRGLKNVKDIFSIQLQQEYFPVQLDAMGAQFEFPTLGDEETFFGVTSQRLPQFHKFPGGSYGLRIQDDSGVLVVCTDIEHPDGTDSRIVKLAENADLLIHDGQYTEEEYKKYKGWGHSTWKQAIDVAIKANVKKLIITHHDPDHDDDFLDSIEEMSKKEFANCAFAKEGMEVMV